MINTALAKWLTQPNEKKTTLKWPNDQPSHSQIIITAQWLTQPSD